MSTLAKIWGAKPDEVIAVSDFSDDEHEVVTAVGTLNGKRFKATVDVVRSPKGRLHSKRNNKAR